MFTDNYTGEKLKPTVWNKIKLHCDKQKLKKLHIQLLKYCFTYKQVGVLKRIHSCCWRSLVIFLQQHLSINWQEQFRNKTKPVTSLWHWYHLSLKQRLWQVYRVLMVWFKFRKKTLLYGMVWSWDGTINYNYLQ